MNNEKLAPDVERQINDEQLKQLNNTISENLVKGSPEERRYRMQLRLLKKLNQKEYENSIKNKRVNSRFS